jgi:hypothetical protein
VSIAAITLCVVSQRVSVVIISLYTQSGNFWIHARTAVNRILRTFLLPGKVLGEGCTSAEQFFLNNCYIMTL